MHQVEFEAVVFCKLHVMIFKFLAPKISHLALDQIFRALPSRSLLAVSKLQLKCEVRHRVARTVEKKIEEASLRRSSWILALESSATNELSTSERAQLLHSHIHTRKM